MVFRLFSKIFLRIKGWKLEGEKPELKKYIIVMAPHTSQSDFFMGKMFGSIKRIKPKFLIKKEAFWFPLGLILRKMGGIPVDRKNNKHLAEDLVKNFTNSEEFILIIAPEGTRKRVKRWKRGFHHIASAANVPLVLSFVDYKTKTIGLGPTIYPTDDYKADLEIIKNFYRDMEGLKPDQFTVGD